MCRESRVNDLWCDDRAQATTEYILMLAIAVMLFMLVWKQLLKPMYDKLQDTLSKRFQNLFGTDFHRFPMRGR